LQEAVEVLVRQLDQHLVEVEVGLVATATHITLKHLVVVDQVKLG
jgi:hypothetical protein